MNATECNRSEAYYHCSQIVFETFVKSKLRIEEMQIRFPFAKSSAVEIASSQVLSAKPTGCRQEGGSQTEQNLVEEKHGQENQRVYKKLVFGCVKKLRKYGSENDFRSVAFYSSIEKWKIWSISSLSFFSSSLASSSPSSYCSKDMKS